MNAPVRITTETPEERAERLEYEAWPRGDYRERAGRIVERVLPLLPSANPLYDRDGFIAASRRRGERERLYWRTFARLRAKAEGGAPYLTLPKDCPALEHGAMATVARELEAEAAAAHLSHIVKGHKAFQDSKGWVG